MKVFFIRLDMRVIRVMILSVLMVFSIGGDLYAEDCQGQGGTCRCSGSVMEICVDKSGFGFYSWEDCSTQDCSGCPLDLSCNTTTIPTVATAAASVTHNSATLGGTVSSDGGATVTARGVCWNGSGNPDIDNDTTVPDGSPGTGGDFVSEIKGLAASTTYYVKAYATNSAGTAYGIQVTFTTNASATAPTVTTNAVSSITGTTASSGGNITLDGGATVTASGVCVGTSANPTTGCTTDGEATGTFPSSITGLSLGTTYYVRAYATNSVDTSYGADVTFTTLNVPTVITGSAPFVSQTTAGFSGSEQSNISNDGGAAITAKGFCYSTSPNPTINDAYTTSFIAQVEDLTPGTTYHFRAYATNDLGTGYGSDETFTTDPPDAPHIVMDPVTVTVNEGSTATFEVTLSEAPTGDVTVAVTRSAGDTNISVQSGASLTFTTSDWNTAQTVTLEATEDSDTSNGIATIQLVATGGLTDTRTLEATESDNDILMTDTASVAVSEGGTGTFNVKLLAQPAGNVTVTVSVSDGDTDISVQTGATLTFTTSDWDTDQEVTLKGAEDEDSDNGTATIQVSATGLTPVNVTATEQDNDILFVTDPTSAVVPEGGTASFNVKLSAQPASDVTVAVARSTGDTDITVQTGGTLTFTTSNWGTNQEVTLAAAEDEDPDSGTATIQISADGLTTVALTAAEQDNDILFVTEPASADVPEGGTVSFNVKLSAQPVSDVTVTVGVLNDGDPSITIQSEASLTFTPANGTTNQQVTLEAAEDDDTVNGTATIQLNAAGIDPKDVTATEQDNDTLALVIDQTSVTVTEGSAVTFDVSLSAQPTDTVTVSVTASGDTDIEALPASLEFTTSTWGTIQKVTVSAAEDPDTTNGTATIQVAATGGLTESKDVEATEGDNDVLALVVDHPSVTVSEGGTATTLNVKLSMAPISDVTVKSTIGGDEHISLTSGGTLTFTTTDWDTNKQITLEAAEDDDTSDGTATIQVVATGGLDESKEVTATEDDNDILEIVTPAASTTVTVTEGTTATFDVSLSAQPDSEVIVNVTRESGDTDISVEPATLSFTTSNWNTSQEVTLTAADDADISSDTATIRLSADGLASVDVNAKEQDDDDLVIITDPTSVAVPEEGTATFNVKLSIQPSDTVTVSVAYESGDTDITVQSDASLTFTTSDWDTGQTVTLAAAKDIDDTDDIAVIQLSAVGLEPVNVTATEEDAGILEGDIDCNGFIDMADLILALKISAGIDTSTETICNADVNADEKISVEEVVYILKELL